MPFGGIQGASIPVTGIWKKIVDTKLSSAATSIDTTGLDLDSHKAYMFVLRTTNSAASASTIKMYFNGDTTDGNYYSQYLRGDGANAQANRPNYPAVGGVVNGTEGLIIGYISRCGFGKVVYECFSNYNEQASIRCMLYFGDWVTENNVTQITFTATVANSLGTNTRLMIFKVSG